MALTAAAAIGVLERHIAALLGYEPENFHRVLQACSVQYGREGESLQLPGNPVSHLWFIAAGSVMISLPVPGKEAQVIDLLLEEDWVTDLQGFLNQIPAMYHIQCMEDAVLCAFDRESFTILRKELPPFAEGFQQVLTDKYVALQQRTAMLAGMDAQQRVLWLMREKPLWFRRVKDKYLATLLGMSRETFSRLKP
jgi:CRP-like cAMP-binding protein